MEREGEVGRRREMERRGRRGGEKRKGLVIGGMVIGLLLGCNNGLAEELALEKRLGEIGRGTENVFYSFMGLIADTLGLRVTEKTTKKQVGEHFNKLGVKIGEASDKLEEVAKKAETGDDKSDSSKNLIREAVDVAKGVLGKLKGHVEALGKIDGGQVGETIQDNGTSDADEIKRVHTALKEIVEIAKGLGIKNLEKDSSTLTAATSIGGTSPENGAKVLTTGTVGSAVGDQASLIVSSVDGDSILESIVTSTAGDVDKEVSGISAATSALAFAKGHGTNSSIASQSALASAVSGGIALRSLLKGNKLSSHSGNDIKAVQAAGITAVNKLLVAVENIIQKTVKNVLGKAKGEIDKARDSKATVQQ